MGISGWRTFLYVLDADDEAIYAYRQSNQSFYEDHELPGVNGDPYGLVIIGNEMWVNDEDDRKLYHYNITESGGISRGSRDINLAPANDHPRGMAVRDIRGTKYIYLVDSSDDFVYVYNVTARGLDTPRGFSLTSGNAEPWGVWIQGDMLWTTDRDDNFIRAHDLSVSGNTLVQRKYVDIAPENSDARGFWSDGTAVWVLDNDDNRLYKYALTSQRDRAGDVSLASSNGEPAGMTCYASGADLPRTSSVGPALLVIDTADNKAYGYRLLSLSSRLSSLDFDLHGLNRGGWGITIDATHVYVSDTNNRFLYRYTTDTGILSSATFALNADNDDSRGVWRGSSGSVHVVDPSDNSIYLYAANGSYRSTKILPSANRSASGIWSTGTVLYVVQDEVSGESSLLAYRQSDLSRLPELDIVLSPHNRDPTGLCGVGERLWVADRIDDDIFAYQVVADSNAQPEFAVEAVTFTIDENSTMGTVVGGAPDLEENGDAEDGDTPVYSISGTHAAYFGVDSATGEITVGGHADGLDFETTPTMSVTLEVRDNRAADFTDDTAIDDTVAITISLNNLEEEGTLTIDVPTNNEARAGVAITATLTDPDGGVTAEMWKWQKRTTGGSWEDIAGATNATYVPVAADIGETLRVQVTYTDTVGPLQSLTSRTFGVVTANRDPSFGDSITAPVSVDENSGEDVAVGEPVTAVDPDGDDLTYSLTGTDAALFTVDVSTGQIRVGSQAVLDEETKDLYRFLLQVTDNKNRLGREDATIDDTVDVYVRVLDVEEDGVVSLDPDPPEAGHVVTASLSDPDGGVSNVTWQWQERLAGGSWSDITDADSEIFTPGLTHIGNELRAVASYSDQNGDNKSAMSAAATVAPGNNQPSFAADTERRSVDENDEGADVGVVVVATDDDGDTLFYSISGTDASLFAVNAGTGQISVAAGTSLDYETKATYSVVISVSDRKDILDGPDTVIDDTVAVTIDAVNVNDAGTVNLPAEAPRVGDQLTAELSDPDGTVSGISWKWEQSRDNGVAWAELSGTTESDGGFRSTYSILLTDFGSAFRITATYTDFHAASQEATETTANTLYSQPSFPDSDEDGVADPYSFSVAELSGGTTVLGSVRATDPDGDTLSYSVSGRDAARFLEAFEVNSINGEITVKSGGMGVDYERQSSYVFIVGVSDGKDDLGQASFVTDDAVRVTVSITNLNESAIFTLSVEGVAIETVTEAGKRIDATLFDPDGGVTGTTWQWQRDGVDIPGATLNRYTPGLDDIGTLLQVQATYTDVLGRAAPTSLPLLVRAANDDPEFSSNTASRTVDENSVATTAIGAVVAATDDDGDTLTYSLDGTDAALFAVDRTTGQIRVASGTTLNFEAKSSYAVILQVTDGKNALAQTDTSIDDTIQVAITVNNVNETGVLSVSTPQASAATTAAVTDPDAVTGSNPTGAVSAVSLWRWEVAETETSTTWETSAGTGSSTNTYTPTLAEAGKWLRVTAVYTDPVHETTHTLRSVVGPVNAKPNEPPSFPDDDVDGNADAFAFTIDENSAGTTPVGAVAATDPDGDTLTYSVSGADATEFQAAFALNTSTGQISVKPGGVVNFEFKLLYSITVGVTDSKDSEGNADSTVDDTVAVAIDVNNVDEPGSLTFTRTNPTAGTSLTAMLVDPDQAVESVTWQWQRSSLTMVDVWEDISGAESASYTPSVPDIGRFLRVVVSYTDFEGPGKSVTGSLPSATLAASGSPMFGQRAVSRHVDENSAGGVAVGNQVGTFDPNGDTLTYSLGGDDASSFTIDADSGQIRVAAGADLDFETKPLYSVTVSVTDNKDSSGNADPAVDDTVVVTIEINNVDEPGTVTVTAGTPTAGTALTAALSDPDGSVTGVIWQWQSTDLTAPVVWEDIEEAESASYTPTAPDIGRFLRVEVFYFDAQSQRRAKTATSAATAAVAAATRAPMFADRTVSLSIDEDSAGGVAVGEPVEADDADGDTLTYSLGGVNRSSFTIDARSGQIRVAAGTQLNHEFKQTYTVTVSVTDGKDSEGNTDSAVDDTVTVTIAVNNVEEPGTVTVTAGTPTAGTALTAALSDPDGSVTGVTWQWQRTSLTMFDVWEDISDAESASYTPGALEIGRFLRAVASYTDGEGSGKVATSGATVAVAAATGAPTFADRVVSRSVDENSAGGVAVGEPVEADDAEGDTLTYSLGGDDASSFTIDAGSGQIRVAAGADLDFETKPLYSVTVSVTDNKDSSGNADPAVDGIVVATINVNNVDDDGSVAVTAGTPTAGTALTAALSDPDGSVTGVTWQWQRTSLTNTGVWEDISGALSASYTPSVPDIGRFLRAVASYTDALGSGKTATSGTTAAVAAATGAPTFADRVVSRSVDENSAGGVAVGEPVEADDADGDTLTYSLDGDDASSFTIDTGSGQIRVAAGADLDFETKPLYSVTVSVTDNKDSSGNADPAVDGIVVVTINVNNVDEAGSVTVNPPPAAGTALTATLSDPDGGVTGVTWQWQRTSLTNTGVWEDISGAGSDSYTPTAQDIGRFLRVVASYTDAEGSAKTATSGTTAVVATATGAPTFADRVVSRSVDENSADGVVVGDPVAARHDDGDVPIYSLSGTDAASFTIDTGSGQIRVAAGADLDFETKPSYVITVSVTDGQDGDGQADAAIDDMVTVTISVTNLDEAGSVTVKPAPVAGIASTAEVSDPDGAVANVTSWTWEVAATRNAINWTAAAGTGAATDTYTPAAAETGLWLRVTAVYPDPVFATAATVRAVVGPVGAANPQAGFPDDDNGGVGDGTADPVSFSVEENAAATTVVGTVAATDADGDTLTYTVTGTDATAFGETFALGVNSGQIRVAAGGVVDFETKPSYVITVSVTDGQDGDGQADAAIDDMVTVTISVTNLDEAGSVTVNPAPVAGIASTAEVSDPDGAVANVTSWVWEVAATRNAINWTAAAGTGAATDTYTPAAAETGQWLRVTAVYPDPVFATAATVRAVVGPVAPGDVKVSFGALTYTVAEGASVTVAVDLDVDPERTVVIPLTAANENSASDADYSGVPPSVTFDSGETSKTFSFTATQDSDDDDGERVRLAFGTLPLGLSEGTTDETVVSIADDDAPGDVKVSFGALTYTVAEGASVTVAVDLDVDPERTVVIPLTAANENSASDADYSGVPPSVTFDSGETSKTFSFTATQDSDDDDGERVRLAFGTLPLGLSEGTTDETVVSIADDDAPGDVKVSFGALTYTVAEGASVTVAVDLDVDPERTVVIPLTAANENSASDADYSGVPPSVTFDSGETSKTFSFTATQDSDDDDGERVRLAFGTLPLGLSEGTTDETVVSIADDDAPGDVKVSFGALTYTVAEGASVTVAVDLDVDPERTVVIPLTAANENSASDADYSGVPPSVTFDSGETSKTFSFTATQDSDDDDGERVRLAFGTLPLGLSEGTTDETVVSIADDDAPGDVKVSFGALTYTVAEGASVTVAVDLDVDPERTVVIPLTAANENSASDADYSGVPPSVTFDSGETSKTFSFTATQDSDDDDGERVRLAFGTLPLGLSEGTTDETVVSIADDDAPGDVKVSFGALTYTVAEGASVTVAVDLDVDPERTVVIPLTAANENSASDADYSGVPPSVTFDSGETSKTFSFTATQDSDDDDGERVRLAFGTLPLGLSEGTTDETVVSIADDDAPGDVKVSFGALTYTVAEGASVTVAVDLDVDPERTVVIPLTAANENSASDADYSGVPPSVTFDSGETSKTFSFTATQDSDDDDGERVRLAFGTLPLGLSEGTTDETVVSIADDDAPGDVKVSFGALTYTVAEGASVTVAVDLDVDPERTVVIPLTAANENSASDADYSGVPPSVTFDSGETSKTFSFTATQDSDDDDGERVRLAFGTLPLGLSEGTTDETVVSIADDDAPGDVKVSFGALTYTVAEGASVTVAVDLDVDPERTVVIPLTAANENSASDADYSGVPPSVTFDSGETSKTFSFTATQDSDDDDGERVRLAFGTLPLGLSEGTTDETVVSIADDDAPGDVKVSFGALTYTVAEGASVTVAVDLDVDPERTVVIPLTAANENSASDADYSGVPPSVTFDSGETSKTFSFTATQDSDDDDGERVRLAFGTLPLGLSEGTTDETVVSIADDDAPGDVKVSFGALTYTVAEGASVTVAVDLDVDPERTVVIPLTAANENSASDADYSGVPPSVTFDSGETSKTFSFTATQDSDDDDGERVRLAFGTLPLGLSEGTTDETVVSIADDDAPGDVKVSFGALTYTVAEGASVTVAVDLDVDPERTVVIPLTAANENSASDADYSGVPPSVTFDSGETSKTFSFTATQDSDDDDGERVRLAFGTLPLGLSEGTTDETVVSIADDDAPGDVKVSFGALTYTVAEGASVTVAVDLDVDPERTVVIPLTAANENSASDADYSGVPPSVTFDSGETSKTFSFTATQDSDDDDGERVRLAFGTLPLGLSEGTTDETVVSIADDDAPGDVKVSFGALTYTVAEGASVTVAVDLDVDPERTVVIPLTAANENSASDADYSGVPPSVTFDSGETSKTFSFTATQDSDDDDGERVRLAFGTLPLGLSEGTTDETVVSIADDDAPGDVKVSFGALTYTVAEGASVTVAVDLDVDPERTVVIPLTAANENSASDADYSGVPPSVTFDSGETSKTFSFTATQDSDDDDGERVRLAFGTLPLGLSEGTTDETVVSIADDDAPGDVKVSFGALTYTVAEGASVTVAVDLDVDPERTVVIPLTAANENSASDADYSGVPPSVTFDSGETSKTFSFTATQDSDDDDGERVRLAFGTLPLGLSEGTTDETVVSIADDDAPGDVKVSFGALTYTVAEGASVTVAVDLDVDPERTVVIPLTAANENSASDADYSGVPPSVTFDSGETSKTFSFTATQDSDDDDGERVRLAFGTLPLGLSEGTTDETVVSIADDDAPGDVKVSFGALTYTVAEGASVTVAVDLDVDPERTVVIPLTAANENSASDADYSGVPPSVTFDSGETSKTFSFTATQDSDDDDGERVRLAFGTLPLGLSEGTTDETVVSIADDDAPGDVKVSFGALTYTVAEGASVTVAVDLDVDPERTVVIPLTAANENSASDADYSGVPPSVTFDSGETSKTFSFTATQDSDDDDGERVRLAFGTLPLGLSEGTTDETVVSIADDDAPGDVKVSFGALTYTVAEGASVTVAVDLDVDPERTVVIPLTAANENSASDADYSGVPPSVTFDSGETSKTFSFTATQDSDDDDGERVRLAFGTLPLGLSEGTTDETVVSIADDDAPGDVKVSFGALTYTVAEGASVTVAVDLDVDPERTVVIPLTAANENSASDADYSGVPPSVTFDSGETSKTFSFTATQDSDDDDGERVRLAFGTLPLGLSEGTTDETVVSIADDDAPGDVKVSFGALTYTVAEGASVTVAVDLDVDPERTVVIPLTAANENSASDADYSGVPPSVTFDSGETSKTFSFTATQDSDDDDGERVRLAFGTLPLGLSEGTTDETVVSIADDDAPGDVKVSFGALTYTVAEGASVTVAVDLDVDPERTVVIPLTAANENSASDADYSGVPPSVTFDSGETSKTFSFTATQDSDDDDGERVRLAFGTLPLGLSEGTTDETVVSIADDDAPGDVKVSFGALTYTVAEGASVTVAVDLDVDPERTVVIPLTAANENSASDADYSGVPPSVTFDSGETSKTFSFTATQDSDDDDGERVRLAFGTLPLGLSEGTTDETVVSIADDDAPGDVKVSFGALTYTVAEGASVTVAVDLDVDPERTVVIPLTAANENSASDADYSGVPPSVTFDSGETSKTFSFTATQDSDDDDGERVRLAFGTLPLGLSEGTTDETVVSIADDDAPGVTITDDAPTIVADPWPPAPGQCSEGTAVTSGVVHGTISRSGEYAYFGVIQDPFVVLNVWIRGSPGPLGALPNPKVLGYRNYHDNFVTGTTYGLHLTHSNGWKWYPATTSRPALWCFAVASGDLGVGHFEVKVEVNTDPLFGGAPGGYVSDIPGDITTDWRAFLAIPSSHFIGDDNAPGDDVDWYGVSLEAGVEYRVTAVPLHDVAARHRLNSPIVTGVYDGSGTLMAGTSSGGGGPPAVSYFTPPSDGAYFVGVSTDGTDPDGLYLLCVDEADQRSSCDP